MEFIGFLSQNMMLRHENVQLEVQLPQNWRIANILTIADVCQRVMFDKGLMVDVCLINV